ncbi:type II toxin-antitoxin system MqsR family toxin [Citrobacter portucalensis]|uniref:type II toxin-antitoxin system MqsR family toxin n=1 Tax=Citrobacter portucalensis TaxID=1639133 RepID=UPI00226B4AF1|nr:type II toxin-antitoxin system MqsR family toxin [Citrobacter portucalensis]MCX8985158.1 type II toxin-antitoxin system MqsR family toxin [Citrobacter portucalensis]
MEKGTPHTRLHIVKELVKAGKVKVVTTAYNTAAAIGFKSRAEMYAVILTLTPADFYKSMTAYNDHTSWHEVYRPTSNGQRLYIKFIVSDGVLIVSFKEL